jgi:hypothetical protein
MKKIVKITESDLVKIIKKYVKEKSIISEQNFLSKLIGSSYDDLFRTFGDDAVKDIEITIQRAVAKPGNYFVKNGIDYLKSASGMEIPMKTIKDIMELVSKGKVGIDEVSKYLPRKLADGTEFRSVFENSLRKKVGQQSSSQIASASSKFETKYLLKNCLSGHFCDKTSIINDFYRKISGVSRLNKFDPSKVRVLERFPVAGRDVINVSLEDGTKVLFYKSSGANVASTGKQAGEWFVIPGFAEDGWFFKTEETINLTKGGNKYLTEMAEFLKVNGLNKLN